MIPPLVGPHQEVSLRRAIARAENDDLRVEIEDPRECREHDVRTLLLAQARHDANERNVGPLGKSELSLERELAGRLARQIVGVKRCGDRGVGARIPRLLVDPVQNAHEVRASDMSDPP
jgi:hypothetical protein